jgi:16S rRNA A1518/A1519 N6-dimethyltransferase RsmA/KsgA/DIM1 with predicted DNA glycosylase/AP lyase activity
METFVVHIQLHAIYTDKLHGNRPVKITAPLQIVALADENRATCLLSGCQLDLAHILANIKGSHSYTLAKIQLYLQVILPLHVHVATNQRKLQYPFED